jgi:Fe2+ transport system protein FeoA
LLAIGNLSASSSETQTCPSCQVAFDPNCASCPTSCPMANGCSVFACPSCGYSFPRPTGLSSWLSRFFAARRAKLAELPAPRSLAEAPRGASVQVTRLESGEDDRDRLSKLAAFGIVEGCEIKVRQRRPALIVEVGETTLALDEEVARAVHVAPSHRAGSAPS